MTAEMAAHVRRRARGLCEYCRMPDAAMRLRFQIDHIVAIQHSGKSTPENLAYACGACNRFKGPNLSGIDPETDEVVRLFDPRGQRWVDHFRFVEATIEGLSPTGRATVQTLKLNHRDDFLLRQSLVIDGYVFDTADPLSL